MMKDRLKDIEKQLRNIFRMALVLAGFLVFVLLVKFNAIQFSPSEHIGEEVATTQPESIPESMIGQIDPESGLVIDEGFEVVKSTCGSCHSTQLVTQNSFSRQGWLDLIRWMQREQNLWDLGDNEAVILDYLEKHRAPKHSGRRKKLENIDWYVLNE